MISEMIAALRAGEELKNAETWKNAQATTGDVQTIIGAVLAIAGLVGFKLDIAPEQLALIAGGVAGLLGVYNSYLTRATSKRIGLPAGNTSPPQPTM